MGEARADLAIRAVRELDARELGLSRPNAITKYPITGDISASVVEDQDEVSSSDLIFTQVSALFADDYAGVILVGPPGTGKSWYAERISRSMVSHDLERRRLVQFHRSYQYEDFVEGYVPREHGGFDLVNKHFVIMCERASADPENTYVLVVDELSRADVVRVFGEALTYLEVDKREQPFRLASGNELAVPVNLRLLATMNLFDRGAQELDLALERRFAKIAIEPNSQVLAKQLALSALPPEVRDGVLEFFSFILGQANEQARIGHAYFMRATSEEALDRLWRHQLEPYFRRVFYLDEDGLRRVLEAWEIMVVSRMTRG